MTVGGMIIVIGSIEIGWHHRDIIRTILPVQKLAVFQTGNLCQSIGFVGFLQFPGKQTVLPHGLGCHPGIDAGGSQELQLPAAMFPGTVNHIHRKHHIVIHEIRQSVVVGHNPTHLGRCQKYICRPLRGKEILHRPLAAQIKFPVSAGEQIPISLLFQFPHNGGTHHSPMSGHIYLRVFLHHNPASSIL